MDFAPAVFSSLLPEEKRRFFPPAFHESEPLELERGVAAIEARFSESIDSELRNERETKGHPGPSGQHACHSVFYRIALRLFGRLCGIVLYPLRMVPVEGRIQVMELGF